MLQEKLLKRMKNIYFYSTDTKISHTSACLMQGLILLGGYKIFSNLDVSNIDSRGLSTPSIYLSEVSVKNHDNSEDILIVDERREISSKIFDPVFIDFYNSLSIISQFKRVIVLSMSDDVNLTAFPANLEVYIAHFNSQANLNPHAKPLPIGVSLDIIQKSENYLKNSKKRSKAIINNFNITLNQSIRAALELSLVPLLESEFQILAESMDNDEYAEKLTSSCAILAYGGSFYQNHLTYKYLKDLNEHNPIALAMNNFAALGKGTAVFRWDSWRFWEAMIFACPAIQLDFEKYGFVFPVIPTPWKHYIPVEFSDLKAIKDTLADALNHNEDYLYELGLNARSWTLENYHPTMYAQRVLDLNGA